MQIKTSELFKSTEFSLHFKYWSRLETLNPYSGCADNLAACLVYHIAMLMPILMKSNSASSSTLKIFKTIL